VSSCLARPGMDQALSDSPGRVRFEEPLMALANGPCRQTGSGMDHLLMLQANKEVSSLHLVKGAPCACYQDSQTVKFCRLGMLSAALAKHLCRPYGNCGHSKGV
jgi:hypothetical protein